VGFEKNVVVKEDMLIKISWVNGKQVEFSIKNTNNDAIYKH